MDQLGKIAWNDKLGQFKTVATSIQAECLHDAGPIGIGSKFSSFDDMNCRLSCGHYHYMKQLLPDGGHGVIGPRNQCVLLPFAWLSHWDQLKGVGAGADVPRNEAHLLCDAPLQIDVPHGILVHTVQMRTIKHSERWKQIMLVHSSDGNNKTFRVIKANYAGAQFRWEQ